MSDSKEVYFWWVLATLGWIVAVLLLGAFLACNEAKAYELEDKNVSIFLMPKSWHMQVRDAGLDGEQWNEQHEGIGISYYDADQNMSVSFMNYDNSIGRNSNALMLERVWVNGIFHWSAGAMIASGYGRNGGPDTTLRVAPLVSGTVGPLTIMHIPLTVTAVKLTIVRF